ncbi:MAG TPA: hypothetical protein DEA90_09200 [Opitutae bacterium]|nr:hypothetical protein [Puniceicoccaceae bacterium]HBR94325.1 hypothetical protein [Opitutae bacterium]|tara:strand:+ start:5574 stop:6287 length:714 start_codon:yes stop_codon:yes gene_type:complete
MRKTILISVLGLLSLVAQGREYTMTINDKAARQRIEPFEDRIILDTFRVGQTGGQRYSRETLIRLFDLWRSQYSPDGRPIAAIEVAEVELIHRQIFQSPGGGTYLLEEHSSPLVVSALEVHSGRRWVGKQYVSAYVFDNGFYNYQSKTGPKTVKLWTELFLSEGGDNGVTREAFVELLRGGETFTVWQPINRLCDLCTGTGELRGDRNFGQHPDEKYACPHCIRGREDTFRKWTVRW